MAALQELARGWKDDPQTLSLLQQRVTDDDDYDVRRAALQELARGWKDDPDLFELFWSIALNDPFQRSDSDFFASIQNNPRQAALSALLQNYPDRRSEVLALLNDRAQQDPDEQLRQWATKQLQNS
jgi:hypothetical protein